jgi:predicted ATP-binding protein involved in virulence
LVTHIARVDSTGLWVRQPNGLVLPLTDMSEGFRATLAMVVELIRYLVEVHGHEGIITPVDGCIVVSYSGIELIDEIDTHLHPEWQRTMGLWLKGIFPKIQFIVSTHSAMICQAADKDGI